MDNAKINLCITAQSTLYVDNLAQPQMFSCLNGNNICKNLNMDLEEFRKSKGLSYKKLAEFLGITGVSPESTVCRWCLKNGMPKPINIKLIMEKTNRKGKPASFSS